LKFHIYTQCFRKSFGEQLHLLSMGQVASMGHVRLKCFLVLVNRAVKGKTGETCQVIGAQRWAETLLAKALELRPLKDPGVALEHVVPMLSDAGHMERGEPDAVTVLGMLGTEEVIALIQPANARGSSLPS
jgi:hypothetical protein